VIEGLEDNRFAIYIKVHHALTDGVGAIPLLTQALAERPDGSWSAPWHHKTTPPDAAGSGSPRRVALKTALGTAAPLARGLVSRKRGSSPEAVCRPFQAPDSVINGTITGARRMGTQQPDLARIKSVAKRTNTLGRRMAVSHLALVVWQADGGGEPDVVLQAIRPLLDELSSDSPLVLVGPAGDVHLWLTPNDISGWPGALPRGLVNALERKGIRVAIGATGVGLAGFVATRRQADIARTVAVLRPHETITRYPDVALLTLLLRDHAAAQVFATEELGGLVGSGRQVSVLRETVRAYLACHLDSTSTARRLRVHRNTISRRLRQAEELLGHPQGERASEVSAALAIVAAAS